MSTTVRVGDKLPLALKLHDENTEQTVRADVFTAYGERLFTVYLYHIENGLYVNHDLPMPDQDYVLVAYTVETSDNYEAVAELFVGLPRNEEWVEGEVQKVTQLDEWVEGFVDET